MFKFTLLLPQSGLKLVDVASFFKRKAIVDEVNKKPPTQVPLTLPQPTLPRPTPPFPHEVIKFPLVINSPLMHACGPPVQVPGIESGLGGIELTSFTKKESATDESTKLESETRPVTEESHDHKALASVDTGKVEAKQEKLEKVSSLIYSS